MARLDVVEAAKTLPMPTLILSGVQDLSTNPEVMKFTASLYSKAEFVSLDPGTHFMPLEQPAAVADALLAFRKRVAADIEESLMAFFAITYAHRNEARWREHVMRHVKWLQDRVADGSLKASGPLVGEPGREAMLIMVAADRQAVLDLIETDPFKIEGLVDDMTVTEWDPMFGAFASDPARGAQ